MKTFATIVKTFEMKKSKEGKSALTIRVVTHEKKKRFITVHQIGQKAWYNRGVKKGSKVLILGNEIQENFIFANFLKVL